MNKVVKFSLIIGLLIAVLTMMGGCFAPATTTADGEPAEPPTFWEQYGMLVFLVVLFAIFYFVMIRPQRKRQKEQQAMTAGLQKGDKVITAGGIYGTIESLNDESVVIKTEGTTMRVARGSVAVRRDDIKK